MRKILHLVGSLAVIFAILTLTACQAELPNGSGNSSSSDSAEPSYTESLPEGTESETPSSVPSSEPAASSSDAVSSSASSSKPSSSSSKPSSSSSKPSSSSGKGDQTVHTHKFSTKTVAATCTAEGYTLKTCSCGKSEKTDKVSALGHSYGEWKTIKAATQTATGLKRRTCSRCKATEDKVIDKLPSVSIGEMNKEILRLVNIERKKAGCSPLEYYYAGQQAAEIRADEIKTKFDHYRPNGEYFNDVLDEQNIDYWTAGENIAHGYRSAEEVVKAWMNSKDHRDNILSKKYTHLVVGVDGTYYVQLFLAF